MTTIQLHFRAGRYHATPWGRHVNEGVPEWPPSPYRFLRALYDVWRRKHPDISESAVRELFTVLGAESPRFGLPPAVGAHTRSYLSSNTGDVSDKSLIFDGFVSVSPDKPCFIVWPVDLNESQKHTLARLLEGLNYLGRSESWVQAEFVSAEPVPGINCEPIGERPGDGQEIVNVASPVPPQEYTGKRDWFDALTYSTTEVLKERRSGPPAMRQVPYFRESLATWLSPRIPHRDRDVSFVEISLNSKVLPLATETIRVGELVRKALMKQAGDKSRLFSGKDSEGHLLSGHEHTFYLPQFDELDRINRILLVLSKGSFGQHELQAIRALRKLWRFDDETLRVIVTQAGSANERRRATKVVSLTPFIPARFWRRGRGDWNEFVVQEVRGECRNHGLPEPVRVEKSGLVNGSGQKNRFEPVHFRRSRKAEVPRRGEGVAIFFQEPVRVPFSLGYCCHFGLGQFIGAD